MTNLEKYEKAFIDAFDIKKDDLSSLKYQGIESWDSVGHMTLIANLEETFDIVMEMDDIIALSSYEKGMEILKDNYDIEL